MEPPKSLEAIRADPRTATVLRIVTGLKLAKKYPNATSLVPLDALFVFRFCESFRSGADADIISAIEKTLEWRESMHEYIKPIHEGDFGVLEKFDLINCQGRLFDAGAASVWMTRWGHADFDRVPSMTKPNGLGDHGLALDEVLLLVKERIFIHMNRLTLSTGLLVKLIDISTIDGHPGLMYAMRHMSISKAVMRASSRSSTLYPQYLSRIIFIEKGGVGAALLAFTKPFISKRTYDKVIMVKDGTAMETWAEIHCEAMRSVVMKRCYPKNIGGALELPEQLVSRRKE